MSHEPETPAPDPQRGALQAIHKHFPPWVWSRFNTREQVQFETAALEVAAAALSAAKAPTGVLEEIHKQISELLRDLAEARAAIREAAQILTHPSEAQITEWEATPAVRAALGEQG